ncbi:MAG: hypothetical protein ACJ735_02770 [Actinomycetes bacterium]
MSSEITAIASWRTGHSPDHRMWAQLGKSTLIPQSVRDKYADRVVLFCTGVSELNSDEAVPAKKVNKHKYGDVVGYRLTVGATYAISLEMRTIRQPGQSTFAPAPDFEFVNDEKQFASSTRVLPFTGNYREVGAWVRPLSRQQAPLNLWWHPRDAPQATTRQDSLGIPLRVPVVVKRHFPVGLALLTLILLLSGGFLLAKAAGEGNDAQTTVSVLIAAATVLVSTGAATLQKAMEAWTKQG